MLNSGSTALPYEPYYSGIRDTAPTSVKSVGSNMFDYDTWIATTSYEEQGYTVRNYQLKPKKVIVLRTAAAPFYIPTRNAENPRDGGAWWAAVYGVAESDMTEAT